MNARLYACTNRTSRPAGRAKARTAGVPAHRKPDAPANRPSYRRAGRREFDFDVWSLCETL